MSAQEAAAVVPLRPTHDFNWPRYKEAVMGAMVRDMELPGFALRVGALLLERLNRNELIAFPGVDLLAKDLGRSARQVRKAISTLIERGHWRMVARSSGGRGCESAYRPVLRPSETVTQESHNSDSGVRKTVTQESAPYKEEPKREPREEPIPTKPPAAAATEPGEARRYKNSQPDESSQLERLGAFISRTFRIKRVDAADYATAWSEALGVEMAFQEVKRAAFLGYRREELRERIGNLIRTGKKPEAADSALPLAAIAPGVPPEFGQSWAAVLDRLRGELSVAAIRSWLEPLILECIKGDCVVLAAGTRFAAEHIRSHYSSQLRALWQHERPEIRRIEITAAPQADNGLNKALTPAL